ncbi:MAG: tetratricopeptide repeat protein [Erysipelotrichaceae bacterium]|nr:tetratricopeptide repeat protein [Erysipelotrichaceae bacterium]
MLNWMILGIEPTKNKELIVSAYRKQLLNVNPEDKPEEFKELRAAYEEALKWADLNDSPNHQNNDPVQLWLDQIHSLYNDFSRRIVPENWEKLLLHDVLTALDTRPLAEDALLNFLKENFYIPQSVWIVLNKTFLWTERKEELDEAYPKDFIQYAVLNGIRYPENLPYHLFQPGISANDCDEFRRIYYQASQSSPDEMSSLVEKLNSLSEHHPYGDLLTYHLMIENGDQAGIAGLKKLADTYPQDLKLQLEWAAQCMKLADWSQAATYTRSILSVFPDAVQAKSMLANCLANQGHYEEAKKLVFQLMDDAGGDQKRIYELNQLIQKWNENLIQILEKQLQQSPDSIKTKLQLGWCYLQNNRSQDTLQLCQAVSPEYEDQYDYHNIIAKALYSLADYTNAFSHLKKTVEILQSMEPDGTEQTETRIQSLPEKLQMQGSCLINMGYLDEAIHKYEQALELAPENPEVLTHMGRLLNYIGKHERAIEIYEKLTAIMPDSYHGFYLLSQTLYDLGRDRDAFESVNRALELEGGDLNVYLLKIRILLRNGAWQGARSLINFLHQHGITDDFNTLWCEAQLFEQGENNKEKALELYRMLASRIEKGEPFQEASKLYFRLLCLEAEKLDANKSEDRAKMLELAEKGLSYDENDFSCLDYKAWLLKRDGQREEALAIYHRLEAVPRRSMNVEEELAQLYYNDLNRDADKALHYYKKLLANSEKPVYLFYAGTCCRYLNQWNEAEQYFLRLQEIAPNDVDGYNGMSFLYEKMKQYDDALVQINKVLELIQDWEGNQSRFYYHKSRILRRLNQPIEAMSVIDELTEKYGNENSYQEKFEICCQFGLWERAKQLLKDWRQNGSKKNRQYAASIDLKLFSGKIDEARSDLKKASKKLNASDYERLSLLIGELDGEEDIQMSIWKKRAEKRQDKTHELMNMAQVQWWNGHYDKAREYAQEALNQLEELIPNKKNFEALYRGRRALSLAILGRFEEAVLELQYVRRLPLCENCNYCSCKDADIFEANMEELRGNWSEALRLHRAGAEQWPDDMDFVSGMRRMMRKE